MNARGFKDNEALRAEAKARRDSRADMVKALQAIAKLGVVTDSGTNAKTIWRAVELARAALAKAGL